MSEWAVAIIFSFFLGLWLGVTGWNNVVIGHCKALGAFRDGEVRYECKAVD